MDSTLSADGIPSSPPNVHERRTPSILIVEDESIVAADILGRLASLGYGSPAIAASGEEAIRKADELKPDVLLMDIVLRGPIDGIEAVRQIRSKRDIPVIYLTAYTDEQTVQRAKQTEPFAYLIKPFDERELRFAIELALHKHRVEQAMRDREERFRQLADTPGDILWLIDAMSTQILYVSASVEAIWGIPPGELLSGKTPWTDTVHQEDQRRVLEMFRKACAGENEILEEEYRVVRPDGTTRWVSTHLYPVHDSRGVVYRVAGTSRDITRQKWAWDTLQESEERYRLMAENSNDLISRHSPEGIYLYASPASRTLLGYRPEELLGTSAYGYIHPDDGERIRRIDSDAGHFLSARTETYRFRKKDGTYVWFETTSRLVHAPDTGELREITAVSRDIHARKLIEATLRRYEFIANAAAEFMTLINRQYVYEAANDAYCNAHGRQRNDVIGHTVAEIWGHETFASIIKGYLDECFSGKPVHYEAWFDIGGRGARFFDVRYYPYTSETGEVTHCVVVSHDMTDRKNVEDKMQSSLREKEVLLKEIHHRVKNNLQIISSLLNLQSSAIENPSTRELVRESQNRVRSMALIHEKLYQSDSLARIDFGEYLRTLTRDLFRSYSAGGVTLKLQAEDIFLDVDTAIPCGLIITELVSNALKYAFPDSRGGELLITFARIARDKYALSVTDDGIGLPKDIDVRNAKTLGLQLVTMLINQLRGTLDVVSEGGTTFMITFTSEPESVSRTAGA